MKLAVVDYGRGNLRSVCKALESLGADVGLVSESKGICGADAVVLPGVGAFGDCSRSIDELGLREPLLDWLRSGRPFLGICLGYQLLFERSEESPEAAGLGFFQGVVRRFSIGKLKIPHMGWNTIEPAPGAALFKGLGEEPSVYFVHSYFPQPADPSIITATCEYGECFAAACGSGNIQAVQFHPEKSQSIGLGILRNFLKLAEASG